MTEGSGVGGAAVHVLELEVGYGTEPVLAGLNLHLAPGEFLALVGASGTGKSTLLRVLAGLCAPRAGEVRLLPADGSPAARVGVVFQEPRLLPWLSARDNVALVLRGPDARRRAEEALAAVGLAAAASLLPKQLSGGMAQRVALARALATAPHVLLLDEPFSAVDALTRLQLHGHLLDLWRRCGCTVLLVTHDVDEALDLADRVAVLAGRPARLAGAFPVHAPRPRDRADPRLARLRAALLQALAAAPPRGEAGAPGPAAAAAPAARG